MKYLALLGILWCALAAGSVAQMTHNDPDPFFRNYVLGNDAELFLVGPGGIGYYNLVNSAFTSEARPGGRGYKKDVVSANFDGSTDDQYAAAFFTSQVVFGMLLSDYYDTITIVTGKHLGDGSTRTIVTMVDHSTFSGLPAVVQLIAAMHDRQVRLVTGHFARDSREQLLVAYSTLSDNVEFKLFAVDSTGNLVSLGGATTSLVAQQAPLYHHSDQFDVTAGDYDADGLDEVCLVAPAGTPWKVGGYQKTITYRFHVSAFDYSYGLTQFTGRVDTVITSSITVPINDPQNIDSMAVDRVSLCSGDLNLDGKDEMALGYEVNWQDSVSVLGMEFWNHWFTATVLEPLQFDADFGALVYDHSKGVIADQWTVVPDYSASFNATHFPVSIGLTSKDLNADTRDEVVISSGRYLSVYSSDNLLNLGCSARRQFFSSYDINRSRMVVVDDLNADTSSANWTPEICAVGFTGDPIFYASNPGDASIRTFTPVVDESGTITGLSDGPTLLVASLGTGPRTPSDRGNWNLAAGDFDGDAIRLGVPRRTVRESVVQPIVVLNAPPTHFDVFDTTYDVNKCYNSNLPTMYSRYESATDSTMLIESQLNNDWGISTELKYGFKFLGMGVKTKLTAKYGEEFSRDVSQSQKLSFAISTDAINDDEVYVTETTYHLFEYPVYFRGSPMGHVLIASPKLQEKNWYPAKDLVVAHNYAPTHEVGNILSYPVYSPFNMNPAFGDTIMMASAGMSLDQNPNKNWSVSITDFNAVGSKRTEKIGVSVGVTVSGWGFEANVTGKYDRTEIVTMKTDVQNQFGMKVHYDALARGIGETNYTVTPYTYWGTNGAMILDYNVAINPETNPWWQVRYGANPDLGFILPWRYDPEKGLPLTDLTKRHRSGDISFMPSLANPGDTIVIRVKIHNFSLMACTQPIHVKLYLGDPDFGGTLLVSQTGDTVISDYATLDPQRFTVLLFDWVIPQDVPGNPKIYAVIDPQNSITEIHRDNNTAYGVLRVAGATGVSDNTDGRAPEKFELGQNYPNPFNPSTRISFAVPRASFVTVRIYDVLGREVGMLVNEYLQAGTYSRPWTAGNFSSGAYFYRMTAGSFVSTRTMLLLK